MWMAYCTDIEVTNLESGIRYLQQQFDRLEFDASHEAVYCMAGPMYEEEYNNLAKRYSEGEELCDLYLDGVISLDALVKGLQQVGLHNFLYRIKEYLPEYLVDALGFNESDEEMENEEEDNGKSDTESQDI